MPFKCCHRRICLRCLRNSPGRTLDEKAGESLYVGKRKDETCEYYISNSAPRAGVVVRANTAIDVRCSSSGTGSSSSSSSRTSQDEDYRGGQDDV